MLSHCKETNMTPNDTATTDYRRGSDMSILQHLSKIHLQYIINIVRLPFEKSESNRWSAEQK